jgi:hypothetical protein
MDIKELAGMGIAEQAKAEVNSESRTEAVKKLKVLYVDLKKAETIVNNIEREIEDYVQAAADGNL